MYFIYVESKRLFDEAMKQGHVLLHTNTLVLMGVAGSGKTSVKDLLLDNPPKEKRTSTPCRDRILHVRPVTNRLVQSTGKKWEEVSHQDMVHLLAQAVKHLAKSSEYKLPSVLQSRLKQMSVSPASSDSATSGTLSPASLVTPVDQAISAIVDLVIEAMILASGQEIDLIQPKKGTELFGTKTMRIMDNGGQPQFQDIASLFVRHASAGLFVMRLTDDFDSYPSDELYENGELVGTPSPSHLSHEETIMSLLRSFLSHGRNPIFIFIGTFLDKLRESKIVLEKNERLLEMLSPALTNKFVYSSPSMNEIIFPLNACSRDADTLSVANEIRKAVEESPASDIEVPLWWFVVELSLQHLSSRLGRGILRKSECVKLAQNLGFDREALEASLEYFDEMCIAHYYPEILPDIVFVDPQVPLDKVSELTQFAISLRDAKEKKTAPSRCAIAPKWKKFRDEGILTIDMLNEFPKHFEQGLFGPTDIVAIMRELLIIAPLSTALFVEADHQLPETEFFMPSLLRSVPPSELEMHRVLDSSADPLLIRFAGGCIRCGVFCCLVVYLMKTCGWQVYLSSGEAVLPARNCVKFKYPKRPCSITLIDSFSYIEIHVKSPLPVCKDLCPVIRMHVISGVELASKSLQYNNDHPEIAVFCPHTVSAEQDAIKTITKKHHAEVDLKSGYWCCLTDIDCNGTLENRHTIWFNNQSSFKEFSGK